MGDHVFLLRLWEAVRANPRDKHKLDLLHVSSRGFAFAEKVHTQISQVVDTKVVKTLDSRKQSNRAVDDSTNHIKGRSTGISRQGSRQDHCDDSRGDYLRNRSRSPINRQNGDTDARYRSNHDEHKHTRIDSTQRDRSRRGDVHIPQRDRLIHEPDSRHINRRGRESDTHEKRQGHDAFRAKDPITALRHALSIGFANRVANRMRMHNGYHTFNVNASVAYVLYSLLLLPGHLCYGVCCFGVFVLY